MVTPTHLRGREFFNLSGDHSVLKLTVLPFIRIGADALFRICELSIPVVYGFSPGRLLRRIVTPSQSLGSDQLLRALYVRFYCFIVAYTYNLGSRKPPLSISMAWNAFTHAVLIVCLRSMQFCSRLGKHDEAFKHLHDRTSVGPPLFKN